MNHYLSEFEVKSKLHRLHHEARLNQLLNVLRSAMNSKKKPALVPAVAYAYRPQDAVCMDCH
jgi:hypothetical protein